MTERYELHSFEFDGVWKHFVVDTGSHRDERRVLATVTQRAHALKIVQALNEL